MDEQLLLFQPLGRTCSRCHQLKDPESFIWAKCAECHRSDKVAAQRRYRVPSLKRGKQFIAGCKRCGTSFTYIMATKSRTLCDLCIRFQQEWSHYRLTGPEVEAMRAAGCSICGTRDPGRKGHSMLHVDHDHGSGVVRGVLCRGCNVGLGSFADDPERLRAAADYLENVGQGAAQVSRGRGNR